MNIILFTVKWQFALMYFDDVIISSQTADEHTEHVRTILLLLEKGATLTLKKCKFYAKKIWLVGTCDTLHSIWNSLLILQARQMT